MGDFDGDVAIERAVMRKIDDSKAAAAEFADDLKAINSLRHWDMSGILDSTLSSAGGDASDAICAEQSIDDCDERGSRLFQDGAIFADTWRSA